ncbi:MAG TPA: hypothetical protein PLJ35_14360 [Anaerolineae bacterium]|nr:hypothetical protein [Anaerolineae bacterium]HPL27208.1 hypothetical protein [Anaerolineae bacterium]
MRALTRRLAFLFRSTEGLVLTAIAAIALTTAIWSTLSGPLAEWGIGGVVARLLGMRLLAAEREGRIIMLYHTIAMAVVAIEVYLITDLIPMKDQWRPMINGTITVGYIMSLVFGLLFAYFGRNWAFHGLFLFGQSLVFFSGLMLTVALWPWQKEYRVKDPDYAHGPGGLDLERLALFAMAVATLGSALFGAVPGSYLGNGFETFMAENVVREPFKTPLQLAVIGHLHIMLTLIAVAALLIIGRWFDFRGRLHKIAMPLLIIGTVIITIGVWMVVPTEELAHFIIYGGSVFVLLPGALLVGFGWNKLITQGTAAQGKTNLVQKLRALLADPLRFGALWQMVYMNFVVTFVGLFMAARLDKVIRVWPAREERIELTGHWHVLSAIIATIILLYYADRAGLKGRARQWFGWLVIVGSDLAFAGVALFETKRLYVSEAAQQPLVTWTQLAMDAGLAVLMVTLAALMVWRLVDLFRSNGRWAKELSGAEQEVSQ